MAQVSTAPVDAAQKRKRARAAQPGVVSMRLASASRLPFFSALKASMRALSSVSSKMESAATRLVNWVAGNVADLVLHPQSSMVPD